MFLIKLQYKYKTVQSKTFKPLKIKKNKNKKHKYMSHKKLHICFYKAQHRSFSTSLNLLSHLTPHSSPLFTI